MALVTGPTRPAGPAASHGDLVLTLFQTSWRGALERGLVMPEDRLAAALPGHARVDGLLVGNPPRRLVARAADRLRRREPGEGLPRAGRTALHEPVRLRRDEPGAVDAARRWALGYEAGLRRAASRLGLERPAILTAHPMLAGFGRFEWASDVTYYAWDDWLASVPHERWWGAFEAAFCGIRAAARPVCAVSAAALERVAPTGPAAIVPNGLERSEWLSPGAAPGWFLALPRPRLLYAGSLDDRVDVEMVSRLAAAFPEGSITIAGPLQRPEHYAPLRALPNVGLPGRVERALLPGLVAAADACVIPHVRTPMTEAMSPLKLYEYLAAGRPVAAVRLPGTAGVSPRVRLCDPGADLAPAVRAALADGPAPEAERLRFVEDNAWERRIDRILDLAFSR
jgi:teichuronic acid biosynthesis glycosyltransferase TuaH